jgi:hypothetical protein
LTRTQSNVAESCSDPFGGERRDGAGGGYGRASFLAELGASRREQCTSAIGELEFCLRNPRHHAVDWHMAPTVVGVVVWFSAIGTIVGLLVVVRHVSASRRRLVRGDQGDLRDLFMCRRGYLGSLVARAAKTFLMELRRAHEKLRPIQRPERLIA